jgi:hypothetical protein
LLLLLLFVVVVVRVVVVVVAPKTSVFYHPSSWEMWQTWLLIDGGGRCGSVSLGASLLAAQDVLEAVLQEVDAAALCQLKAVSVAWYTQARRELCNRLCRRAGQPEAAGVAGITDLDVAVLSDAGRPWEVVVAGRQLPQLARLHGFGFVVDVQAVREADLDSEGDDDAEEEDDGAPLGGAALRSCIEGEGEPPHELLLAAVACAAPGTVQGVPVQLLREDVAIGSLNFDEHGLGAYGAVLLGLITCCRPRRLCTVSSFSITS